VGPAEADPAGQQQALWQLAGSPAGDQGILHRVRTGAQWRDLPERFGPWKTVYERHRLWSVDGTWKRLLQQVQAEADAVGEIDWDISVDSTVVRAHQHAAGARIAPPPTPASKGAAKVEHQDETPWQSLHGRLVKVVLEMRAWAAREAASPAEST
jgi:transposase